MLVANPVALIIQLIYSLTDAYTLVLFVYVIMSWLPSMPDIVGDIYRVLGKLSDPFLNLFRRFIPPIGGMVDISPIVAVFVLQFGVRIIVSLLVQIGF